MIQVKFKNLKKSEMTKKVVVERVENLIEKFSGLIESRIQVTLEMENSPLKAGPDLFKVKIHLSRGRYDGIIVEKSDANLYVGLAQLMDHMLEVLNRFGDRARVKERKKARQLITNIEFELDADDEKVG